MLTSGTRLGPYDIVAAIGAGGMGEVYRARDRHLDRTVAIKILPHAFASDPERLARCEREAKTLASLNHPHIAQIHGFEKGDGVSALVMEFVDGEDLAARLARDPLAVDEAILVGRQIAEALEAAHEKGIVHRDLKPANVRLTPEGVVKVLDFGLAKAISSATGATGATGATRATDATELGVIVGTAAYMSPEQARGQVVDKRSDIWSFGCVVYELLTGRLAFGGGSVTDTLSAITRDDPDWNRLPTTTPPAVRRLLWRCLSKDPKRRLRDIGDAVLELDAALDANEPTTTSSTRRVARGVPLWLFVVALGVAVAGAIVDDRKH